MDEKVYKYADVKNNPTDLIISLLMFTRAHDESLTKRIGLKPVLVRWYDTTWQENREHQQKP